jgi:hypothetical protein
VLKHISRVAAPATSAQRYFGIAASITLIIDSNILMNAAVTKLVKMLFAFVT